MGSTSINPYQTPQGNDYRAEAVGDRHASASAVFFAWEKLRIWYNAILLLETLILLPAFWADWVEWRRVPAQLVASAVIANICFCVGPCAEGYLTWLGVSRQKARACVFVSGMLVAGALVVAQLYDITYPLF